MNEYLIKDILEMENKCRKFIKDTSTPIKKQHGENIEKYLERFIKFPGATSVVSVLFTSSTIVKSSNIAILGMVFIFTSFLIVLNIFRKQINNDKSFYNKIHEIEKPMADFTRKLTVFSRNTTQHNEVSLNESYKKLIDSYDDDYDGGDDNKILKKFNEVYFYINLSFWLLVIGVILSFISIFNICIS